MLGASSSSHHKSSHRKGSVTSVTVRKNTPDEKLGIKLYQDSVGRVRVKEIARNGVFCDVDDIQVGDIVMSVNGKRLKAGEDVSVLHEVIKSATVKVTMVVRQDRPEGAGEGGTAGSDGGKSSGSSKKKAGKETDTKADDNARKSRKSYQGKTKHNTDGSIKLGVSVHDSNDVGEQVTISASKMTPNQDSMIDYIVSDGSLYVSSIDKDSIFIDTELEIGDRVLSINDMSFRSYAEVKYAKKMTEKSKIVVTLVVEKGGSVPSILEGKKKDSGSGKSSNSKRGSSVSDESSTASCTSFGGDDEVDCIKPLQPLKEYKEMVVTAPKEHFHQQAGLTLEVKDGALLVQKIGPHSIFKGTSLEVGDRILAVNDVTSFIRRPDVDLARRTMLRAKEAISLVIEKENVNWASTNFDLDASATNLVY